MKHFLTVVLLLACLGITSAKGNTDKRWKHCWQGSKDLIDSLKHFDPATGDTKQLVKKITQMRDKLHLKNSRKRRFIAAKLSKIEFLLESAMKISKEDLRAINTQKLDSLIEDLEQSEQKTVGSIRTYLDTLSLSPQNLGITTLIELTSVIEKGKDNLRTSSQDVSDEINRLRQQLMLFHSENKSIRQQIFDICHEIELRYRLM